MKISGRYNSPDNWRNYFDDCPVVLIDDVAVEHVCEADDVEGYVVVEVQENGRPKVSGGSIATIRSTGKVKFVGKRLPR